MQFNSVINHDDFYSNESDDKHDKSNVKESLVRQNDLNFMGITSMRNNKSSNQLLHVRDAFGYYVMYDASMKDLDDLENELILVASQYICRSSGIKKLRFDKKYL